MLPTNPEYYGALIVVFFAFWIFRRTGPAAIALICAVNLFFYARWGWIYLLLVPAAATGDFFLARAMHQATNQFVRRGLVSISVLVNAGLILFCRYAPRRGLVLSLSLS